MFKGVIRLENFSVFKDFESYVTENEKLINYLNNSLLNDLIIPIVKTLTYLENLDKEDELSIDNIEIFEFGFEYLFENLEQIKIYLHQFKNNYEVLEAKSVYIKMIFQLEEFKVELTKKEETDTEMKRDLKKIDEAINFFDESLTSTIIIEHELEDYLRFYYELTDKYDDIYLVSDSFNEYCANYGI
ncbi:MAG: hypothetical protein K0Q49_296 [Haloplasmataceae bacterium]|jgi:hypothetical protein|nr:hypothetical protein [Haloplasmataceae bacterium]